MNGCMDEWMDNWNVWFAWVYIGAMNWLLDIRINDWMNECINGWMEG